MKRLSELIDDKLELLQAVLEIATDGEITERLSNIMDAQDVAISKKVDRFRGTVELMEDMVTRNKQTISDINYANERIELGMGKLHKLYYHLIKHRLEMDQLNSTHYKYIPRIAKKSSVNKELLTDEDLFVNIKMKKKDWIQWKDLLEPKVLSDAIVAVKDVFPTVSELDNSHEAKEVELTEKVVWRVNTNQLDDTKRLEDANK